jgi:hypothetical protein
MKRIVLKSSILLFAVVITGILTGCKDKKPDIITGDGNIVSREITASAFHGVTTDGVANVYVHPSTGYYRVEITTDNNIQHLVFAEVKDNVLYIDTKPDMSFRPTILHVDVHLPEVKNIHLKGAGNIFLSSSGAPDLDVTLSGVGEIDAQNYRVQNVTITHSGVGDAKIWATNSLKGTLSGVGNILYVGNPKVEINVTGVGKLYQVEP